MNTVVLSLHNEMWYSENLMLNGNNIGKKKSNSISAYNAIWDCKLVKITIDRYGFSGIELLVCCLVHSNMVQIQLNDYYQRSTLISQC